MRGFLVFLGGGILLVIAVFYYAQTKRDEMVVATTEDFTSNFKGRVLSATTQAPTAVPTVNVKISLDKPSVGIFYPQKITVETEPNAQVKLRITYPNGSINNNGSKNGKADKSGKFISDWDIIGEKINGTAKVEAFIVSNGKTGYAQTQFDIVKARGTPPPTRAIFPTDSPSPSPPAPAH